MSRISRALALYDRLKKEPYTVNQLAEQNLESCTVSVRQIYRDLKDVKRLSEANGEELVVESDGRHNRKIWKILPNPEQTPLPADDLNTYLISRAVLPGVFAEQRKPSLERLQQSLQRQVISSKAIKYKAGISEETFANSHFYENRVTRELDRKLTDLLEELGQQRSIIITELVGDATAVRDIMQLPTEVMPIKLLFHRGCFYLAAVREADKRVLIFQIDQLTWQPGQSFKKLGSLQKLVDVDLKNRFGVTQNFNIGTYKIRLLFSETTGKFVGEQNWHHSQKIEPVVSPTGKVNYVFTLTCGINRELVGWLFQWMSNVKVLGPPELVDLYNEQLDRMMAIRGQATDTPLEYTNKFAPQTNAT